jgi:hypothetical protein
MRSTPRGWPLALLAAISLVAIACDDDKSPTAPTAPLDVSGRWATDITIQTVPTRMTWTLTQSATGSVTGPVLVGLGNGIVLLNGILTGTLTGSSLASTIAVAPGGIPSQPTCTGQLGGTMTVTSGAVSTMVGPMTVISSNCTLQLPSTNVTLTKQ